MQINIGDKVRFLNDVGGGKVTSILDSKTAMVLNEETDFEVPVLKSELVVIKSASTEEYDAKNEKQSSTEIPVRTELKQNLEKNEDVFLAFVPKENQEVTESPLDLYLINDSSYNLFYSFHDEVSGSYEGVTAEYLEPRTKVLLEEYDNEELGELSSYLFHLVFYQKGKYKLKKPIEKQLNVQPVKFYKSNSFKENDYFNEKVILHKLTETSSEQIVKDFSNRDIREIIKEKEFPVEKNKVFTPNLKDKNDIVEVDLHINVLLDSVVGMSNFEILEYQLNKFHEVLRENENKKGQRIVFIHGIGNGTLKNKIYNELQRKYKRHYQQDASFKEYGWGATMVTIRQ